jgi:hypothetical protein
MKRVAFCIKGAVSKKGHVHDRFYKQNDLYKYGDYIDYRLVRDSIFKHIVTVNKEYCFDFFLHGWNLDIESDLCEIYKPKKYLFEDNNNYNKVINSFISDESDFGGVSGSLSLKKSIELKEMYEFENNLNYDIVIIYRYDVLIWKNIFLDNYNINDYIYVNGWDNSCNADYHFIMSNENSKKFKYLYDSVYIYNNKHLFHYWIKNFISNIYGLKLKEDNIIAGIDQEHMRVLFNKKI